MYTVLFNINSVTSEKCIIMGYVHTKTNVSIFLDQVKTHSNANKTKNLKIKRFIHGKY
jgi:hypothetical protein